MSTFAILAGFALMLFLPCAVAMRGSRDTEDASVYSDRTIQPIVGARAARAFAVEARSIPASSPVTAVTAPAIPAARKPAKPSPKAPEPVVKAGADPVFHNRTPKTHQARILRNEIEALMATAAAARAQADALAASARLAVAKAEAADAVATAAEDAAADAIQAMRRAA